MRLLLILFIILPIAEMAVLIKVGTLIGVLPTIALVVLTAVMGVSLMRVQGLATLARVQEKLQRGEIPETELLEGVMLLIGGALLLTPGFITDTMGFICLIPGLRQPIARWIMARGIRSVPIGKLAMLRWVCAPQYRSAGTSTSPMASRSVRVSVMGFASR